ncbi:MAG: carbohydrate kinase [Clostridiales bacterium]|nr:carbohydrate kinase [Clostridiales bacterium]
MKYDVVALGELLVDFTDEGVSKRGNSIFEANSGGAPCNVLAMLTRLGKKTAFIGKVGKDLFGGMLKSAITRVGIDASNLIEDAAANTTLAFVKTDDDGDREFAFYRKASADTLLRTDEVNEKLIENCSFFHFGTLSLTHEPAAATRFAVRAAKHAGARISFDPNLRRPLWENLADAKAQMRWGFGMCDVLKVAEDELRFFYDDTPSAANYSPEATNYTEKPLKAIENMPIYNMPPIADYSPEAANCTEKPLKAIEDMPIYNMPSIADYAEKLQKEFPNISILFVTKGKDGSEGFCGDIHAEAPAFCVKTLDTTGAGDTFFGCCLARISELDNAPPTKPWLTETLLFANAAAALVTAKKGALSVMPNRAEIDDLKNSKN